MPMISGEKLGAALTEAMILKGVGPKQVAEHFGVKAPSVKDWQKRGCIHKKHLGRLVAYFAEAVPPGHWGADADELIAFAPQSRPNTALTAQESVADYTLANRTGLGVYPFQRGYQDVTLTPMAPVLAWARLGADLHRANKEWPAGDLKAVPTKREVSDKVKWVPVVDDSLAPKILPGDLVAIDPMGIPKRDEIALFETPEGAFMIRRWRPLPGGGFEAFDAQGRSLDGDRHGLKCIGSCVGLFQETP